MLALTVFECSSNCELLFVRDPLDALAVCRDAERTSRILASLMAAAQETGNKTQGAELTINLSPAMDTLVKAAAGAAQSIGQPIGEEGSLAAHIVALCVSNELSHKKLSAGH